MEKLVREEGCSSQKGCCERWEQKVGVKAKQRVLRTKTQQTLQRWVEHLSEISNRDDPRNPVKEDKRVESEEIEEIDLGRSR